MGQIDLARAVCDADATVLVPVPVTLNFQILLYVGPRVDRVKEHHSWTKIVPLRADRFLDELQILYAHVAFR